jgi:catechol 2,3-dioxygenase-like lactoylglutathione lyase family enzyme
MSEVGVRYVVDDVPAAVRFYTTVLGFVLEQDASPAFAAVSRHGVRLLLSGDGSSGKRPLADGRRQVPGGWNRTPSGGDRTVAQEDSDHADG